MQFHLLNCSTFFFNSDLFDFYPLLIFFACNLFSIENYSMGIQFTSQNNENNQAANTLLVSS